MVNCSIFSVYGEHHPATNSTTLRPHLKDITARQGSHQYEKLNDETMGLRTDPNWVTECSGIEYSPSQCYPGMPALNYPSLQCGDIISQCMTAMVKQQFDTWVKSNYSVPNVISPVNKGEYHHNQFSSSPGNRYPTTMDRKPQYQGVGTFPDGYRGRCRGSGRGNGGNGSGICQNLNVFKHLSHWPQGINTVDRPYIVKQRPPLPTVETQDYGIGFRVNEGMSHYPECQDRSDGDLKSIRDAKPFESHYFVPDGDVNLNEGADGYLLPGVNANHLHSPSHGQKGGIDSFGLPLTKYET